MNEGDRRGRLEGLQATLEGLSASPARDWLLAEVRGRAVDVETGAATAPLRAFPGDEALTEEAAPAPAPRPARAARRRIPRAAPMSLPPLREPARDREDVVDLLGLGGMLTLDDAPTAGGDENRPWARGLRG